MLTTFICVVYAQVEQVSVSSLAQLGNLIKIPVEVSQTGKERHILYRYSCLHQQCFAAHQKRTETNNMLLPNLTKNGLSQILEKSVLENEKYA